MYLWQFMLCLFHVYWVFQQIFNIQPKTSEIVCGCISKVSLNVGIIKLKNIFTSFTYMATFSSITITHTHTKISNFDKLIHY